MSAQASGAGDVKFPPSSSSLLGTPNYLALCKETRKKSLKLTFPISFIVIVHHNIKSKVASAERPFYLCCRSSISSGSSVAGLASRARPFQPPGPGDDKHI
jgi:hypothetical protein